MSTTRKKISDDDKRIIGTKCCNCGAMTDLQYHHIVPLSLGGNDVMTNYCCLCFKCHALIHFGKHKNINHSYATKKGIDKARANGKQIGRVVGQKYITNKEKKAKEIILKNSKDFMGTNRDQEVMKIAGISRNSYYKYKSELKHEWEEI